MSRSRPRSRASRPDVRLAECLPADRARLRRPSRRDGLEGEITKSIERQKTRRARAIDVRYPEDLPIASRRDEIAAAIRDHQVVVVCGETGSGKSTQLPKICLDVGRGRDGLIGHTQPRRIAARTIATRIADELGTSLGDLVGYTVRFSDRTPAEAFVKVMTDGILLAELGRDRRLDAYDTIIIDEAHERSLNIDFLLGYLKQLLPRRPDLKVIITSATIDPDRFSAHFDKAPIIEVSGRLYPVDVLYQPLAADAELSDRGQVPAILAAVDELATRGPGDVLVFLAGEREIRETAEALRKHHPPGTEILPLYARLSIEQQNKVFQPHPGRRIVLATNVAETSLTVPGIRYVVDPGLARISRYSARSRVQRLPVEAISQASARQRAGRCGRLGPGVCIRLYSEEDFDKREPFTAPEILRTNLASVILQMTALGLGNIETFPFLDPPKRAMIRDGRETLFELGAIDERDKLTELGRRLSRLPIDPRLGRMLVAADREGCLTEILVIASALSVQDPRERPAEKRDAADAAHRALEGTGSDFLGLLALWAFYHDRKKHLSWNKLRLACRENYLSFVRMREWHDVHGQLRSLAGEMGLRSNATPAPPEAVHQAVLSGLLRHVGRKGERREFEGTHGGTFFVFPGSSLFKQSPKWVVASEIVETTRRYARTVGPIQPAWIERVAPHLVRRRYSDPRWDARAGRVVADERVSLWGLEIVAGRRVGYGAIDPEAARELFIHHALVENEWDRAIPPIERNRETIESIRREEAKHRRRDLLVDPQLIFAFYDARVPPEVCTTRAFEDWWRRTERREPKKLDLTRADLVRDDAQIPDPTLFPETLSTAAGELPLDYALDPGGGGDGVTLTVPLARIGQLTARDVDWIVPGLVEEKITAVIRGLPKATRRHLVPAPDFARACAARLDFGREEFAVAVARVLAQMSHTEIDPAAIDLREMPDHLRLRVQVVDNDGRVVATDRELLPLQHELASASVAAFSADAADFTREGVTTWDIGDLPERIALGPGVDGYPALVERDGGRVDLTVFPDPEMAAHAHRGGARRLLLLACREEVLFQLEHLPGLAEARLLATPLGAANRVEDAVTRLVADRVFLAGGVPRTPDAFQAALDRGWSDVGYASVEVIEQVLAVLRARQSLETSLAAMDKPVFQDTVAAVREHLARLAPSDVFEITPPEMVPHLPRYLAALERRLEKLKGGGLDRDRRHAATLEPLWSRYTARLTAHTERGMLDPALARYRWMLEEMSVATFAQELGTAETVSLKRLERQWRKVQAA